MHIGIYGGSFNPIHRGHIALARQLVAQHLTDEVWFLVTPQNPFKTASPDLLDDDLRLQLARRALEGERALVASDYEFGLPRPSYTWNTLCALAHDYPQHTFSLVIGADNWLAFDRWSHADDIVAHYRVLVYPREGCPVSPDGLPPTVQLVDTPLFRYNSTEIRQRIAAGRPVRRMLPPAIADEVVEAYRRRLKPLAG